MKDRIFEVLQRIGRSFMLPVAILPAAGLLLGLGSSFTNKTTITAYHLEWLLGAGTLLHALLVLMNEVGSAIFDNLPLIFAVGVAIGMAKKEKEVAALGVEKRQIEVNYGVGDTIRITDGPMEGFAGIVKELDVEKDKVKVVVSMFGRETPVELELDQVQLDD